MSIDHSSYVGFTGHHPKSWCICGVTGRPHPNGSFRRARDRAPAVRKWRVIRILTYQCVCVCVRVFSTVCVCEIGNTNRIRISLEIDDKPWNWVTLFQTEPYPYLIIPILKRTFSHCWFWPFVLKPLFHISAGVKHPK